MGSLPGGRWGNERGPVKHPRFIRWKIETPRVLWENKCWENWSNYRRRLQTKRYSGELVRIWWDWDKTAREKRKSSDGSIVFRAWLERLFDGFPKEVVVKLTPDENNARIVGVENGKDRDIFEKELVEKLEKVSKVELIIVDLRPQPNRNLWRKS